MNLEEELREGPEQYLDSPSFYGITRRKYMTASWSSEESLMSQSNSRALGVYEIFAIYAENPKSPVVFRPKIRYATGFDEEEAKIASGIYVVIAAAKKEPTTDPLDPAYLTVVCRKIAETTKFKNDA